ncbi:MAG: hypothetical protein ACM3YM_09440 [Sphingomonadales bacterium]
MQKGTDEQASHVPHEPGKVSAENGRVVIRCPSGATVIFTPDAAVITSDRLLRAGLIAKRQEIDRAGRPGADPD